jgi:hypothetical protein
MSPRRPIDLLSLFGQFGREQRLSLRDPEAQIQFLESVKASMKDALENDALLHGQRTQNMFEALAVSLGEYKLLKLEDAGRVHPKGDYTAPDFRMVLADGRQWLIEVKNVYDRDPTRQRLQLRKVDVDKLAAYARAVGCPLKFALYWARWRIWTLVNADDFDPVGTKLVIDMLKAAVVSDLGEIGDRTIGTTPPLTLRLTVDPTKDRSIAEGGEAKFTIGDAKLLCGGKEITNPTEQAIAYMFMQYGDWEGGEPIAIISDDELAAIDFKWTPRERSNEGENFEMIGRLSTMFARYFAEQTIGSDGLVQTEADMVPGWFRPLIDPAHKSDALPLWRFIIQSNRAEKGT